VLHGSRQSDSDSRIRIDPIPTHRNIEILAGLNKRSVAVPMTQ